MWLAEPGADPMEGWPPAAKVLACLVVVGGFIMLFIFGRSDD